MFLTFPDLDGISSDSDPQMLRSLSEDFSLAPFELPRALPRYSCRKGIALVQWTGHPLHHRYSLETGMPAKMKFRKRVSISHRIRPFDY